MTSWSQRANSLRRLWIIYEEFMWICHILEWPLKEMCWKEGKEIKSSICLCQKLATLLHSKSRFSYVVVGKIKVGYFYHILIHAWVSYAKKKIMAQGRYVKNIFGKGPTKTTSALLMDSDPSILVTILFYHLYSPPPSSPSWIVG